MTDDRVSERARAPADVGPTDHRLTSGIEADAGDSDARSSGDGRDASGGGSAETSGSGAITPKWASAIRNVLAGLIFVLVGIYLALGQTDPHGGMAQIVVFAGLLVGLYGFITWPPSRNVS